MREEGQARRPWLCLFRSLPPSSAASCRWSHLAVTTKSAEDPNELSPLKRVEPNNLGVCWERGKQCLLWGKGSVKTRRSARVRPASLTPREGLVAFDGALGSGRDAVNGYRRRREAGCERLAKISLRTAQFSRNVRRSRWVSYTRSLYRRFIVTT